ncbi:MAG TPA: OmpA family protein [Candidatus Binatia bacterium]|jgi:outer membrane protein OmpA-like peptidoglycan-associated protein|nr:OmpA family protein [Candidatus Binatia bacterium]
MKGMTLLFLILGILSFAAVSAQESLLQTPPLDLIGPVLDLEFHTEDLKGATQELEVKETDTEVKIELSGDILFDFDKWNLRPEAEPILSRVAEVIKQYPQGSVLIEGHSDAKGLDSYNLPLSQKRADSVKDWLIKKRGINGKQLTTKGWGKAKPVAPNTNPEGGDNPEGRQKNRRVEVTVKKHSSPSSARPTDSPEATRVAAPLVAKPPPAEESAREQRQVKRPIPATPEVPLGWYRVMVATPLRSEPRPSAEILTQLQRQTRVWVVGSAGDYLAVRSMKKEKPPGYVLRKDVVFVNSKE